MANSDKIMCIIESLMSETITIDEKLKLYSEIKELLNSFYNEEVVVLKEEDSLRYLFTCIQFDLKTDNSNVQYEGLVVLQKFFTFEWRAPLVKEVNKEFRTLAFAETGTLEIKEAALKCVEMCLRELVLHDICNPEEIFAEVSSDKDKLEIVNLFEKLCKNESISSEHWSKLLYEIVIQQMFCSKNTEMRKFLILLAFKILPYFPISLLSHNKLEHFKIKVKVSYIGQIGELRKSKDPNWHHLCKFLCACLGKLLHNPADISVTNSILKHLEAAFRSHVEDKICAYECWKSLIDNYSLNLERMKTSKQINLLLTPLKTNLSKDQKVICKRYEAWSYLISIIKEHSFICLVPWLEFCFGPLDINPFEADHDSSIRSCGRKVITLWEKSTLSLSEILGHYEHNKNDCVFDCEKSLLQLKDPIINASNFLKCSIAIVSAVGECTYLLIKWMDREIIAKAVKCLWGSLMNVISQLNDYLPDKEIGRAMLYLEALTEKSWENPDYGQHLVVPILELFVSNRFIEIDAFHKLIFFPIIKIYVNSNKEFLERGKTVVLALLMNNKPTRNKAKWLEQMNNALSTNISVKSVDYALKIWLEITDVVVAVYKESNESEYMKIVESFIIWPIKFINLIQGNNLKDFISTWGSKLIELFKIDTKIIEVFKTIQQSHTSSPMLLNNVASLFSEAQWIFTINSTELCTALLNLLYEILSNPNLNKSNAELLHNYVKEFGSIYSTNDFYKEQKIDVLYKILEDLCNKQLFETIHTIKMLFDKCPKFKENFPLTLQKCVIEMRKNDNIEISRVANGLQAKFLALQKTNVITPISKFFKTPFESTSYVKPPSLISLFGQSVETSPVQIRGSQLNKVDREKSKKETPKSNRNKRNSSFLVDDDEANYVLIDSDYQFNPDTLSSHQLEVLKKRRADIPALYQDLSQSQSNSQAIFDKFVNSQEPKTTEVDSANDEASASTSKIVEHVKSRNSSKDNVVKLPSPLPSYQDVFKSSVQKKAEPKTSPTKSRQKIKSRRHSDFANSSQKEISKATNEKDGECSGLKAIIQNDKVQKELAKIKMDIVGGDFFVNNLNLTNRVRTRRSVDLPELKKESSKKSKQKQPSGIQKLPVQKLNSKVEEKKEEASQNANSEDVIESSQDSLMETICQKTTEEIPSKRDDIQVADSESIFSDDQQAALPCQNMETEVIEPITNLLNSETIEIESVSDSQKSDVTQIVEPELVQESESSDLFAEECTESKCDEMTLQNVVVESPDELIDKDIAVNTLCQMNTAEMNTESLDILSTPQKPTNIDISSSPVQVDTPTRNKELLNNTSDISPIKSLLQLDFNMEEKIQKTQEMLDCDSKSSCPNSLSSSKVVQKFTPKNSKPDRILNGRALRNILLKQVPKNAKIYTKVYGESRIMKMLKNCGEELRNIETTTVENSEEKTDFLQFDKPLPSPLASPKVSILKRKAPDSRDEDVSPPRKVQKKVNFSDPPTTCKKLYVQYDNEHLGYISNEIGAVECVHTSETQIQSQLQDMPTLQDLPSVQDMVIVEDLVSVQNLPTVQDVAIGQDLPTVQDIAIVQDLPTVEEMAIVQDLPTVEEMAIVQDLPTVEDMAIVQDLPTVEDMAIVQDLPAIPEDGSLSTEEPPIVSTTPTLKPIQTLCLKANEVVSVRKALLNLSEKMRRNSVDGSSEQLNTNQAEKSKIDTNNKTVTSKTNSQAEKSKIDTNNETVTSQTNSSALEVPVNKRRRIPLITLSSPKKSHPSVIWTYGSATTNGAVLNERSSLEDFVSEVGMQIDRIKVMAVKKNVNSATLFRDIVSKIGNSECISILQDNKSLSINNLVKNDDWSLIIGDILKLIGLNRLVSTLNSLSSDFVKSIYHTLPEDKSQELIRIGLQNLQLEKTVDILHGYFSKKHILNTVVLQLNPSLSDAVSCFQYINFVELNGDTVVRSEEEEEDFDQFVEKIIKVANKSTVSKLLTTHNSLIPISDFKNTVSTLPPQELKKLIFPLLDKIPHAEIFKYLYKRLTTNPDGE